MADGYYQIPTRPRIYVSYPLFAYATGGLGGFDAKDTYDVTDEEFARMIQLDPANYTTFNVDEETSNIKLLYRCVNASYAHNNYNTDWYNFNYMMLLGHNFGTSKINVYPTMYSSNLQGSLPLYERTGLENNMEQIQNYIGSPSDIADNIQYDGWSALKMNSTIPNQDCQYFGININPTSDDGTWETDRISLGSLLFGRYWTAPNNINMTGIDYDYGTKSKTTISGKSLTNINWSKPNGWVDNNEAWGLQNPYDNNPDYTLGANNFAKTGRRKWQLSFDSLNPKYVMNQNPMQNSYGWNTKDNYDTVGDGLTSTHNLYDSSNNDDSLGDFYTDIVHKTLNGALPMVLQLDKDDPSPSNMAIVKMSKDYKITQKTPNLYNIKIELIEQI